MMKRMRLKIDDYDGFKWNCEIALMKFCNFIDRHSRECGNPDLVI